jgi:hypothetical protein
MIETRHRTPINQAPASLPLGSRLLQRNCNCGQHAVAGGACTACSKQQHLRLQTKLSVGEPGDRYEQEADRIADRVMAMPAHDAVADAPLHVQRFVAQTSRHSEEIPDTAGRVLTSPGRPLHTDLRQDMEQKFGYDFSKVRVHSDPAAALSAGALHANAYTVGNDIVFAAGRLEPGTRTGQRLLAHELTHVVQQSTATELTGAKPGDKLSASVRMRSPATVLQREVPPQAPQPAVPTGIRLAESLPFGHADLRSDELKQRYRTYLGAVTRLQVTPAGDYRGHCAKEYLTAVANTCPPRFAELRSGGFCTGNRCLEFGRWGTAGDPNTGKTVTDTQDSFIDRHRTRHNESLLEGTGRDRCSVVCHQRFKYDRQHDLGSFYIIRNFRAGQYTPTGSSQSLHITTGEVNKVPASLAAPTAAEFARNIAPGLVQSGVLGEAPQSDGG